ncbi:hypothetical protein HPB49_010999 [Dermacentor silvarum]|uniref:Uncharacterized protein n=1 Tax=Dermacentor silvarum TaxID=543639 RepID=A0ACB8D4S6_DERSI|nr:hypothetical protein HPB49_010999 [Dermacentor silvarum]
MKVSLISETMTEKCFFKLRNNLHIVAEDSGFDSEDRLWKLRPYRILAAGTVRKNWLGKCPLESKKVINKKRRGYSAEYVTSDDVVVVIWKDNNDVSVASNFVGIGNEEDVRRWDKTKREHIFVKQPEIIAKYNRSTGGVHKMDFLLSLYRTKIRSKKWTLRAIFHFVDLAVCNAWMEYLRENAHTRQSKLLDLLHFRLQIAEALISSVPNTRKRGRSPYEVETQDVPEERKSPHSTALLGCTLRWNGSLARSSGPNASF